MFSNCYLVIISTLQMKLTFCLLCRCIDNSEIKTNFKKIHHIRNELFTLISKNLFSEPFQPDFLLLIQYVRTILLDAENHGFFYVRFTVSLFCRVKSWK